MARPLIVSNRLLTKGLRTNQSRSFQLSEGGRPTAPGATSRQSNNGWRGWPGWFGPHEVGELMCTQLAADCMIPVFLI
ncbi:hypothetical protein [Hymenobacter sp. YC55]|uniref:hypothetical protein n=1 Tax=Hymenobacter sp. YC55 TaxID=3034019 RepID=UPI0023F61ED3|nr:hypothetical protein [Hymenobacter sp. YC55]MDF7813852.1 hypothetical protein [Hymenobacter sp. YC55]